MTFQLTAIEQCCSVMPLFLKNKIDIFEEMKIGDVPASTMYYYLQFSVERDVCLKCLLQEGHKSALFWHKDWISCMK